MKSTLTITILILVGQFVFAQKQSIWTIDTIEQFPTKTLVEYKAYSDSTLKEQAQAFFYPVVKQVPRFPLLGNFFTTEIELDSIVFHGNRIKFLDSREFMTEKFENGILVSTKYFDSNGEMISEQEFTKLNYDRGPCGLITGHYFLHGKKKIKK